MSHKRQSKTCAASHPAHFGASGRPEVDRPPHSQAVPTDRAQLECGQEFKSLFVKKVLMRYELAVTSLPRPDTSAAPPPRATARGT
jgi:hypothetical protein